MLLLLEIDWYVFAAHNTLGKAQILLAFSPDDTQAIQIGIYAMGENSEDKYRRKAPEASYRFNLIERKNISSMFFISLSLMLSAGTLKVETI